MQNFILGEDDHVGIIDQINTSDEPPPPSQVDKSETIYAGNSTQLDILNSFAASFDCSKATSPTDKSICSDSELSKLDETLASVYAKLYSINPDIKSNQRDWIKGNRQCKESLNPVSCLKDSYKNRLSWFADLTDPNRGVIGVQLDFSGLVSLGQGPGILIVGVYPNSPAQSAGLKKGDIILQVNGKPINPDPNLLRTFTLSAAPGSMVNLLIWEMESTKEVLVKAGINPFAL